MKTKIVVLIVLNLFINQMLYAADKINNIHTADNKDLGMGQIAINLMEPLGLLLNLLYTACFIVGGGLIFAGIVKYFEHKNSPLMIPISLVVTLIISGLVLIFLPFISYLSGYGFLYVFTPLQQ